MINDKNPFAPYLLQETYVCGYLLESPRRGDSNKYLYTYVSWSIECSILKYL